MDQKPQGTSNQPAPEPTILPDVATGPHPTTPAVGQAPADVPKAAAGILQEALPDISEAARKVGGYKNLSEIAKQMGEAEGGQ
jgi:hypothetical protein